MGTASVTPAGASGTVSLYLDGSATAATTCTLAGGVCSWSISGVAIGGHSLTATYAGSIDYAGSSTASGVSLSVSAPPQAPAVATGDSRTVTEPSFPSVCSQLTAALTSVNDDIPASVDAMVTNPDQARIQLALNGCAGTGQAVELSIDGAGHNAFLTGPLTMPSNVTLLVDPGVICLLLAQRAGLRQGCRHAHLRHRQLCQCNRFVPAADRDSRHLDQRRHHGLWQAGRPRRRSADQCLPVDLPGPKLVGIVHHRQRRRQSAESALHPDCIPAPATSRCTRSRCATRRSSTSPPPARSSDFTAWDIKIVTPTSSRNTDGIDPGNATNFTITGRGSRMATTISRSGPPARRSRSNISVTNNRFFAGHGESIGSYTQRRREQYPL